MLWRRELYASPNGDRWFLARDTASDRPYVLHQPNKASGGLPQEIDVGSFLVTGGGGPEHQELLRLIGTLAEEGLLIEQPDQHRSHWTVASGPS